MTRRGECHCFDFVVEALSEKFKRVQTMTLALSNRCSFLATKEKKMNLHKQTLGIALAIMTALTMTASIVSGKAMQDNQLSAKPSEKTIEGVWRTVVTFRNCQTGDALASFQGVFTFHEGGTMSEFGVGPGSSPALRSPGHGLWRRALGWQDYEFTFFHYRYNATGVLLGTQKIRATLQLGSSGDEFTSVSASQALDPDDNVLGNFCATSVGTRFEFQ